VRHVCYIEAWLKVKLLPQRLDLLIIMDGGIVQEDMHFVIIPMSCSHLFKEFAECVSLEAVIPDSKGEKAMAITDCSTNCQARIAIGSILDQDVATLAGPGL
jgi:hypothetical protein